MKRIFTLLVLVSCLIVVNSCKKNPPQTLTTPPQTYKPPVANAGADQTVSVGCNNNALLSGFGSASTSVNTYLWKQISGPNQCNIVNANAGVSLLTNITQGVYQFVLEVKDNFGASATDTTEITVVANIPEIIFSNLTWNYPPDDDVPSLFAPSRPDLFCDTSRVKEVSIQLPNSSDWIPVTKTIGFGPYIYQIYRGSDLRVFGYNGWLIGTKASVKVKFL
jgi:hypothetical protein